MLERRAVKVACVVLRGLGEGGLAWLPGAYTYHTEEYLCLKLDI
jgi:hypothetical protein